MTSRRITIVASELLGYVRTGGLGTATTFLALALARLGHRVEILYIGEPVEVPMDDEWSGLYEQVGVGVRMLPPSDTVVEPALFARMRDTEGALAADPPDVVITQDSGAPVYTTLRLRQAGLAFESTLFVVFCHGTRQWVKQVTGNVRVLPDVLGENVFEQEALALADVAVSPSAYMLDWMRRQNWQLPLTSLVIPLVTRAGALGELPLRRPEVSEGRIERIVFFGRLEERKGLRPFTEALNTLDPALLRGLELEFIGKPTKYWTPDRIEALLSASVRQTLRRLSFEPQLDQHEALTRLSRPGTLVVMPSLADNSPNVIYECLEHGLPFLASGVGGISELVAVEDRDRVLFEPTTAGVARALRAVLTAGHVPRPARPAFDDAASLRRWAEVVAVRPPEPARIAERPPPVDVVVSQHGLRDGRAPWIVLLDEDDLPEDDLVDVLVRAQSASQADVVTCGVRVRDTKGQVVDRLFYGEPGALGLLENHYGTVALMRRSLLDEVAKEDWPLLTQLSLRGARIVSIPKVLVERRARPSDAGSALNVVQQFERQLPTPLQTLARLAAGLAAEARRPAPDVPTGAARHGLRRMLQRLR